MAGMAVKILFPTLLFEAEISDVQLIVDLAHSIRSLAREDAAGRSWSKKNGYAGYTSYASLNDLPKRDPGFASLAKILTRNAAAFAKQCGFDHSHRPRLDSLWVNLMKGSGHHSAHIHPNSIISGTFYVEVPEGSGAIRFEDPRLQLMMAAPPRRGDAEEGLRSFATVAPRSGLVLLWESWLRHEVLKGSGRQERLSISFNFA